MRPRFEFALHRVDAGATGGPVDPALALLGSQGWEIRGIASLASGALEVALQRPLDEPVPLPDGMTLAATLEAPLSTRELETSDES